MKPNLGVTSRGLRLVLGIAFLALLWGCRTPWGLLGLPLIVSAVAGWCPVCPSRSNAERESGV